MKNLKKYMALVVCLFGTCMYSQQANRDSPIPDKQVEIGKPDEVKSASIFYEYYREYSQLRVYYEVPSTRLWDPTDAEHEIYVARMAFIQNPNHRYTRMIETQRKLRYNTKSYNGGNYKVVRLEVQYFLIE